MVVGEENLLTWFQGLDNPYWKVKNKEGGSNIDSSSVDPKLTLSESITHLRQRLNLLGSGRYHIECWKTIGQTKERFKMDFELVRAHGLSGHSGSIATSQDIETAVQRAVTEAKEKWEQDQKMTELLNEIKELKEGGGPNNGWKRLEPYLPSILSKMGITKETTAAASVSGVSEEEVAERTENAIKDWAEADPDGFLSAIEGVAKLAKDNPKKYKTAKNFL